MITLQAKDYAEAILEALAKHPQKEKEIFRRAVQAIASRRDFSKWRKIIDIFERLYIRARGEKFIDVYVAGDEKKYRSAVLRAVPKKARVSFHIDPSLIGGMK